MQPTTPEWILYLDESGPFEEGEAHGLVGGVLLDVSRVELGVGALTQALMRCYPCSPWPLHATDLRRPMSHVAGAMLRGLAADALPPAVAKVLPLVDATPEGPLAEFRRLVQQRQTPRQELLDSARGHLFRLDPQACSALQTYVRNCDVSLSHLLGALTGVLHGRVFAFGAAVGRREPYAAAFEACVHHALRCLRRPGPQPALRLTVAERNVSLHTLENWSARAAQLDDAEGPWAPDVEVTCDSPKAMNASVTPWLVLADFICNRLWGPVRRASRWERLVDEAHTLVRLPVLFPVERLSANLPCVTFRPGAAMPGWGAGAEECWTRAAGGVA